MTEKTLAEGAPAEETLVVEAGHPSLAGHFPDQPIVPGALLLDRAVDFARRRSGRTIAGVRAAKFRNTLAPEVACRLRLAERPNGVIEVICETADAVVMTALLDTD